MDIESLNDDVFQIIILFVGKGIYDLEKLASVSKEFRQKCWKSKVLDRLVIRNLDILFQDKFQLDFMKFSNLMARYGLALSGSTLLYGITGPSWAQDSVSSTVDGGSKICDDSVPEDDDNLKFMAPNDLDLYSITCNSNRNYDCDASRLIFDLQTNFGLYISPVEQTLAGDNHNLQNMLFIRKCLLAVGIPLTEAKHYKNQFAMWILLMENRFLPEMPKCQIESGEYTATFFSRMLFVKSQEKKKVCKVDIIYSDQFSTNFKKFDFDFLRSSYDPSNTVKPFNYEKSIDSILTRGRRLKEGCVATAKSPFGIYETRSAMQIPQLACVFDETTIPFSASNKKLETLFKRKIPSPYNIKGVTLISFQRIYSSVWDEYLLLRERCWKYQKRGFFTMTNTYLTSLLIAPENSYSVYSEQAKLDKQRIKCAIQQLYVDLSRIDNC